MEEAQKILEFLEDIQLTFGIAGVILAIALGLSIFLSFRYLVTHTEKIAEESSEKSLKKYQTELDKKLTEFNVKFSAKHQKQLDAIHETYTELVQLSSLIEFMIHGDNYVEPMEPKEELEYIYRLRKSFKKKFEINKLVFSTRICSIIESLFPLVDEFISKYQSGILAYTSEDAFAFGEDDKGEIYLAGMWPNDKFDSVVQKLNEVKTNIEAEFREIYGIQ